jgi:hypothetical protein
MKELVLESNCDAHSSGDKDISALSDSNTDSETDDVTDTNFTQWTDDTNCQPTVPVVVYKGSQWVMTKKNHPTSINTLLYLVSTARQGRQAPFMRPDTTHKRHWLT